MLATIPSDDLVKTADNQILSKFIFTSRSYFELQTDSWLHIGGVTRCHCDHRHLDRYVAFQQFNRFAKLRGGRSA